MTELKIIVSYIIFILSSFLILFLEVVMLKVGVEVLP